MYSWCNCISLALIRAIATVKFYGLRPTHILWLQSHWFYHLPHPKESQYKIWHFLFPMYGLQDILLIDFTNSHITGCA